MGAVLERTKVLTWQRAFEAGPAVCGGKGYNLARLARYGFAVPQGGVLGVEAYRETIRESGRLERLQAGREIALPTGVSGALAAFLQEEGLENVALAVRSSGTAEDSAGASFAGIYRSVLQVRGLAAVEQAVALCYGSLWTEQARAYSSHVGLSAAGVECAVVLCRMVARPGSDKPVRAGIAFTADPATGRRDLLVIEAAAGLGDEIVGGRVTPTRSVLRRSALQFVPESLPRTGPLSSEQSVELAHAADRIEWALGEGQDPQDIEWAHDGERFWFLQARPITRLPRAGGPELCRHPQYWSTANIKEAVAGVTSQLGWSVVRAAIPEVAFATPRAAGYLLPQGTELVRRFAGRAYFDTTEMQWVMFDSLAVAPADFARMMGGAFPLIEVDVRHALRGRAGLRRVRFLARAFRNLRKIEQRLTQVFESYIADERKRADAPVDGLRRAEIAGLFAAYYAQQLRIDQLVGLANGAANKWLPALEKLLQRRFGAEGSPLCAALCAGSGTVTSAEHGYAANVLAEAARSDADARSWLLAEPRSSDWRQLPEQSPFRGQLERFLAQFGHRSTYEGDLMNPRWADDASPVLDEVRRRLSQVGRECDVRTAALATRHRAEVRIRGEAPLLWPIVQYLARGLRSAWALRELGKSALCAGALTTRRLVVEVGSRMAAEGHLESAGEVFHLSFADLAAWLSGEWDGRGARALAGDNRLRREGWLREAAPPDTIPGDGGKAAAIELAAPAHGDAWTGIAASPGHARAVARVLLHPDDGDRLQTGEILVAPSTDPGWTPLFLRASAVVTEVGGYLSHSAIVAREYGLPAVVNIPGLLGLVRDGEVLEVDGDAGRVWRVRSE
jgi:pyruvate,water dikinase